MELSEMKRSDVERSDMEPEAIGAFLARTTGIVVYVLLYHVYGWV